MARNATRSASAATSPAPDMSALLAALLATPEGKAAVLAALGSDAPTGKGKSSAKARKLPAWAKSQAQADKALAYRKAKREFLAARTPATWAAYSAAWDAYDAVRPELLQTKFRAPGADGATTAGPALVMAPVGRGVLTPANGTGNGKAATRKADAVHPVAAPTPIREAAVASAPRRTPAQAQAENAVNAALPEARTLKSALIRAEAKINATKQPAGIKANIVGLIRELLTPDMWAAYQAAR